MSARTLRTHRGAGLRKRSGLFSYLRLRLFLLLLSVRGLERRKESRQRMFRRRGALTLLLTMELCTFEFRRTGAARQGNLRKKCRLYGKGLSPRSFLWSELDIPLSRLPFFPHPHGHIFPPLSLGIQLGVGGGETEMGKDDIRE